MLLLMVAGSFAGESEADLGSVSALLLPVELPRGGVAVAGKANNKPNQARQGRVPQFE
jgi:hypothetical protein